MRLDRAAKRILVADDSQTYRSILERVLIDAGYRVSVVADGEALLASLADPASDLDLLVLELNLPKVRGIDVLRKVREENPPRNLQVLVVSEFLSEHLRQVLADLGVTQNVNKYHALRDLLYEVDGLLFPAERNQRRSVRKLGHLPVNYWVGEKLYLQYCFDLSAEGMFIILTEESPPPEGMKVNLRFWLPSSDKLVATTGEVVWHNSPDKGLRISHPPGMGVRFLDLDGDDARMIAEFVQAL